MLSWFFSNIIGCFFKNHNKQQYFCKAKIRCYFCHSRNLYIQAIFLHVNFMWFFSCEIHMKFMNVFFTWISCENFHLKFTFLPRKITWNLLEILPVYILKALSTNAQEIIMIYYLLYQRNLKLKENHIQQYSLFLYMFMWPIKSIHRILLSNIPPLDIVFAHLMINYKHVDWAYVEKVLN